MALMRVGAGHNLTFIIYIPFCQHMGNQIIIINSSEASWDQTLSFDISQL